MSGALKANMFDVYTSWTGAEILWRTDEIDPFVVLLRCGRTSVSDRVRLCLTRRVVNALDTIDISAVEESEIVLLARMARMGPRPAQKCFVSSWGLP